MKRTCLLGVLSVALYGCSPVTPRLSPDELLLALAQVPEVPYPVLTSENQSHPGLQDAVEYCDAVSLLRSGLPWVVAEIQDRDAHVSTRGAVFEWSWTNPETPLWSFVLRVSVGDTLWIQWERLADSPNDERQWNGWVSIDDGEGYLDYGVDYFHWRAEAEHVRVGGTWALKSISVVDSTQGGASIAVSEMSVGVRVFQAGWDEYGHGWFQSGTTYGEW